MKQLNCPKKIVFDTLGNQEYDSKKIYGLSYFCLAKKIDDNLLLFNNFTKELLIFDKYEFEFIGEGSYKFNENLIEYLTKNWFLIPNDTDEVLLCDQVRSILRLLSQNEGINSYTILTTTGCNARCFYCFEAGAPVINMTEKTANDVVEYINKNHTKNKVVLNWFGGEPLCNTKAIDVIVDGLKKNNIGYVSIMTSNGYLFNKELAQKAKSVWNMKRVQITLDVLHEIYAKTKNYVNNDKNPLDKVLQNIEYLLKNDINVNIRLNLGLYNIDELRKLSVFLIDRFKEYNNFVLYVVPIYENEGFEKTNYSVFDRMTLYNALVELNELFENSGVSGGARNINDIKLTSCLADSKDKVMILPDGKLGFCEHNVSSDFFGTIYDNTLKPKWCDYKKTESVCRKCVAYPSCLLLEKCSSASHKCYEYDQYLRIKSVEKTVMNIYKKYLMELNSEC